MTTAQANRPTLKSYLSVILMPSISGWWAVLTGVIGIVGWVVVPTSTITFDKIWLIIVIVVVSFSVFVGISVVYRGWLLYLDRHENISVSAILKSDSDRVFLLGGSRNVKIGSILEIYRIQESLEVPIGLIEVIHEQQDGGVQAKPVWIMPGHLRDIELGQLAVQNLMVYRTLSENTLRRWINDEAEIKIQNLLRRGSES